MCGRICGQLAVLLFSSDWVTAGTTYCTSLSLFCLVEPFSLKVVPHASPSMDGFLHLSTFYPTTVRRDSAVSQSDQLKRSRAE